MWTPKILLEERGRIEEKKWREAGEYLGGNEGIDEEEVCSKPLLPGVVQTVAGT